VPLSLPACLPACLPGFLILMKNTVTPRSGPAAAKGRTPA
jgi:hypothetical protein